MEATVKIGRTTYTVTSIKQFKGKPYIGQIDYKKKTIKLALYGGITGEALTSAEMIQAYTHEFVHAILHDMKHPVNKDEKFVDNFAKRIRLMQVKVVSAPNQNARSKNAANLVTHRLEGLRKLRKKVPRGAGSKKIQAR